MYDDLDIKVIRELQTDGRRSYAELADKLGVVEGTVRRRVKRLVQDDIVRVVGAPNLRKLGYGFIATVGLQVRMADLRSVADSLARNKHVCYLAFVTGRYDLMAMIITRSPEELSGFIEKEISAIPAILRSETFVNLDIIKGAPTLLDTTHIVDALQAPTPESKKRPAKRH